MQTAQRHGRAGVIDSLIAAPHRFQCAQAVRLLLRWLRHHGVSHQQAFEHVLRFDNSLALGFPASEIECLRWDAAGDGETSAPVPRHIRVTPAFIGLLGGRGALPLHDTQRLAALPAGEAADGARAFYDFVSNRMMALFCQAWGKYRLEYTLDTQGRDGQLPLLLALSGAGNAVPAAWQHMAAHYAALMRSRPVSAATIGQLLGGHFGVGVTVEQFSGSWDYLPARHRSILARTSPRLGLSAVLGVRQWRRDRQARLNIGPLDRATLETFLPNGKAAAALARVLAMLGAPGLRYEVRLVLGAACIAPMVLGTRRLGWDTFIPGPGGIVDRPEVRYLLGDPI